MIFKEKKKNIKRHPEQSEGSSTKFYKILRNKALRMTLISIILASGFISVAMCAVLEQGVLAQKIKKNITEQLESLVGGKIEVDVAALPYQEIELPDGKIEVKTDIDLANLSSSIIKVGIFVDGIKVRSFGARVDIKVFEDVMVAQDWIKRGETLKNLKAEEKDISSMMDDVVKKDLGSGNYLARRNIKPGEIINKNYIEKVPTIVKNSPVSLIFKTPLVSVTVPAIAMTSGKIGDYIKVKNKESRKSYVGKIIGENIVLVNI